MKSIIGLHGKMGSGKDTVFERLLAISTRFHRMSFADPLKQSAAALLGVSVKELEEWKRDPSITINVGRNAQINPYTSRSMNVRTYLQRYGTEAHREVFGDTFWIDQAMGRMERHRLQSAQRRVGPYTYVFTDVRFENEAHEILDRGGEVWHVKGPDDDTGEHASEKMIPIALIDRYIDNTLRDDNYASLTNQLRSILDDLQVGSANEPNPDRPHGGSKLGLLG